MCSHSGTSAAHRIFSVAGFLFAIYLGAALAGSLASWQLRASPWFRRRRPGAIFGLLGAGMVLGLRYRRALPAMMGRRIFGSLAFWAVSTS